MKQIDEPRFHLRFEWIHPYIDGNGSTGRLIMNLELSLFMQDDLEHTKLPKEEIVKLLKT